MWILILTLLTNNGAALTTAGGFDTKKSCEVAGQAWQKESKDWGFHVSGYYRCVNKANIPPDFNYKK